VALAISPAITSPPATDTTSSSGYDCDHGDHGDDAQLYRRRNGGRGRSLSPASQQESDWNRY